MNQERIYQVLLSPHVSEKATQAAEADSRHTFRVAIDADKYEIRRAVETAFGVVVDEVRVQRVKGKRKRHGQRIGHRGDWKKATVKVADGHDIDLNAIEVN